MRSTRKLRYSGRLTLVTAVFGLAMGALLWRMVDLHIYDREFLQGQGDARYLRVVSIPAHRGMLLDRHGEPLAISTPVESVWGNPQELLTARERLPELAQVLEMPMERLTQLLERRITREFVYLRRHTAPSLAKQVMDLGLPGVSLQREYQRFYPMGEVAAHVVGFTDIDDNGQEGAELMLDTQLRGTPGSKRVIKDRLGRVVKSVESIRTARPGRDIRLSIDRRIQYLAYRELKAAVQRHGAKAGSAIVLDSRTGEVLAMANQPAYNPNNRRDLNDEHYRNRAVTDLFEPGSTVKPFTIGAALESGRYHPESLVDTTPGWLQLAGFKIRDARDYGRVSLSTIIQKSSNVGASRVALSLQPEHLWKAFNHVGFGWVTGSGFPGDSAGLFKHYYEWDEAMQATVSYGYGLSVTPLQLARAYAVLAYDGGLRPVSFVALAEASHATGIDALKSTTVEQLRGMLAQVVASGGTGTRAQVTGYQVAGKTGTVRKANAGGYSEERYVAVFAGMAPSSRPRLVIVVAIDEPTAGEYYGGVVAAPVFARVMDGALRLLGVVPDATEGSVLKRADAGGRV